MDEYAFKLRTSFSINQGMAPIYKADGTKTEVDVKNFSVDGEEYSYGQVIDENGNSIKGLTTFSLYGGKDLGQWYALSDFQASPPIEYNLTVKLLGYATDFNTGEPVSGADCVDTSHEPMIEKDICVVNIFDEFEVLNRKSEYKSAFLMSYFNKNFLNFLKPDIHPAANGLPYLMSGSSLYVTYHQAIEKNGETYYSDIPSKTEIYDRDNGGFKSVKEAIKVDNVTLHLNDALGFRTLKTHSSTKLAGEDNKIGYYEFMYLIPPEISDSLELRALARGYKVTRDSRISITDRIDAYEKKRYDFYLEKAPASELGEFFDDKPANNAIWFGFEGKKTISSYGWSVEDIKMLESSISFVTPEKVTWNIVNNSSLPVTNSYFQKLFGSEQNSILPAYAGVQYAWFGNLSSGTYTDTPNSINSSESIGKALISPVIDFSNLTLAKASIKAWFEISGEDEIPDSAFIAFMIQDGGEFDNDGYTSLDWLFGADNEIKTGKIYAKKLTPSLLPPSIPNENTKQISNMGFNREARWQNYDVDLHFLAGKKAKIIFGFLTKDRKNSNFRGFGVDSILIYDDAKTVDLDTKIYTEYKPSKSEESSSFADISFFLDDF